MPPNPIPHTIKVCEMVAVIPSSTACHTLPLIATMKAAIIVLEWPGSSPCNAPSRMALGMNSHACEAPWAIKSENDSMDSVLRGTW